MKIIKLGAIQNWEPLNGGSLLFQSPKKTRAVAFEVNTQEPATLVARHALGDTFLGHVHGAARLEFTIYGLTEVEVITKGKVFVKLDARDMTLPYVERETFTDLEYRPKPQDDMARMMRLMERNEEVRQAQHAEAERAREHRLAEILSQVQNASRPAQGNARPSDPPATPVPVEEKKEPDKSETSGSNAD